MHQWSTEFIIIGLKLTVIAFSCIRILDDLKYVGNKQRFASNTVGRKLVRITKCAINNIDK